MQQTVYNLDKGRENRDSGMQTAVNHADAISPGWSVRAYSLLQRYLKDYHGEFMAEDFRSFCAQVDFDLPPHARAFGGVINRAAKAGLIRKVRIDQVKNTKAHCANAAVWVKNIAA